MAPPRKTAERRQNRATKDLVVVAGVAPIKTPPAVAGWLAETKREWGELWSSNLAGRIEPTDHPAVRRLFGWRDKQIRAERRATALRKVAAKEPLVEGSKGQLVANPMWGAADAADAEALHIETRIVALEDRLGLSPKARLALGLTEQKGMNLAGQNARLAMAIQEAMQSAEDPRALEGDPAIEVG